MCSNKTKLAGHLVAIALIVGVATSLHAQSADDAFATAYRHYSSSQWSEAAESLVKFSSDHASHPRANEALFYAAEALVQSEKLGDASKMLEQLTAKEIDPELRRQADFRLAEIAYLDGDDAGARQRLIAFRQGYPGDSLNAMVLMYLGEIDLAAEQTDSAIQLFTESLEQFPRATCREQVQLGLACAWLRQKQVRPAVDILTRLAKSSDETVVRSAKELLDIAAENETVVGGTPLPPAEVALTRARQLQQARQFDAAIAAFTAIYRQYPDSPQAPLAKLGAARIHLELKQFREAEGLLASIDENASNVTNFDAVLYERAWALAMMEVLTRSDELFEKLHTEYADSPYWADATYRLAERAARRGETKSASNYVTKVLESKCEDSIREHALYLKGQLAATDQQWEVVAQAMEDLLANNSASQLAPAARYWQAEATFRRKDFEKSAELFEKLAVETDGRPEPWLAMVQLRRAQILAHHEEWQQSLDLLTELRKRFPTFAQKHEADYLEGRCLAALALLDEARQAYMRVLASASGNDTETAAMAAWMIGESYFHQKKYVEAIDAYQRCAREHKFPAWQSASLLQAGKCLQLQGKNEEASEHYRRVVNEFADTTFAVEARERLAATGTQTVETAGNSTPTIRE